MCKAGQVETMNRENTRTGTSTPSGKGGVEFSEPPIKELLDPPTLLARYTCASILIGILAIWTNFAFIEESQIPDGRNHVIHDGSALIPFGMTAFYLISLPLLRMFTENFLSKKVDVKLLLREAMIIYNATQVVLNGWMVYRIVDSILFRGHHFMSGPIYLVNTGAPYAVYVHYCDKYLEYLDTYFMILRGRMDQVSFLHVYHHTSIAIAWWIGLKLHPAGDIYFGALLNSFIHVLMYSYYTLSLLKISCPWKKYLTMAQLTQFVTVLVYSFVSAMNTPEEATWTNKIGYAIQSFEMISLFAFFMHFYRKAYAKKPAKKASGSESISSDPKSEQVSISSTSSDEQ